MDDALLVRGVEGLGNLTRDVDHLRTQEGTSLEAHAQRLAVEQLQHQADSAR